jgi:hypothetical protein
MKKSKLIITIGILLILSYIFRYYLFKEFWIFGMLPIGLLGVFFAIVLGFSILKKKRESIIIGLLVILSIITIDSFSWEVFKSKKVLEAYLDDDLTGMHLILRENNEFEIRSYFMFGDEYFHGKYNIRENQIIFHDRPYINDFIPDTITIVDEKIILKFDQDGVPNTQFANYFEIRLNKLNELNQ